MGKVRWTARAVVFIILGLTLIPAPQNIPVPDSCKPVKLEKEKVTPQTERKFDLVVMGATGFTGKLVVDYLARTQKDLNWAIAGRNRAKLVALLSDVDVNDNKKPEIIVADSLDAEALTLLAQSTKVVVSTAGPYTSFGMPLVQACAEEGTHYADLSGEFFFQRDAMNKHAVTAQKTGSKIVVAAGYDSVPFDLGAALAVRELEKIAGPPPLSSTTSIRSMVTNGRGWLSGGTLAAMVIGVKEAVTGVKTGKMTFEESNDPYILIPEANGLEHGCVRVDTEATGFGSLPRFDAVLGHFGVPHFMAYVNSRIVRRSMFLNDPARRISYSEGMSFGAAIDAFVWAVPHILRGEAKLLPAPGEGPSEVMRETGGYEMKVVATRDDSEDKVEIKGVGYGDPGE